VRGRQLTFREPSIYALKEFPRQIGHAGDKRRAGPVSKDAALVLVPKQMVSVHAYPPILAPAKKIYSISGLTSVTEEAQVSSVHILLKT
jgi:hypothetical protein